MTAFGTAAAATVVQVVSNVVVQNAVAAFRSYSKCTYVLLCSEKGRTLKEEPCILFLRLLDSKVCPLSHFLKRNSYETNLFKCYLFSLSSTLQLVSIQKSNVDAL